MNNVIPLARVDRETVRDMAKAAVANGIPLSEANPFEKGSVNHAHFEHDYHAYDLELATVDY
ncbi:hypothetical protein [Polaromonas sp.]|uniref:hypothetical protein n=1 Tax=Polaromonas sp. TaxID=1869339 RepID=UPI003264BE06